MENHDHVKEEKEEKKVKKRMIKVDKKVVNVILIILLLLIPMSLSFYYRIQPAYLPFMDEQAENNVINYYKNQISNEVESKFAYFPPEKRAELVDEQFRVLLEENGDMINEQVEETARQMKAMIQDDKNNTYLIAIDPWMQYKYTKNYLETGTVGDTVIDGKGYVTLRDGREENAESNRFHPWLMAQMHKVLRIFDGNLDPMKTVFLFPLIWVTLSVIPAFFIGRRLSNNLGGFITATLVAVHHAIMSRTVAGFSDTDAYNVFFPLFILWFIIEAYFVVGWKKKTIFASLAGLFTGFYSITWTGWWYTYDFVIMSILGFIIYKIIKDRKQIKKKISELMSDSIAIGVTYLLSVMVFVVGLQGLFSGKSFGISVNIFTSALRMPFKFLQYQDVGITTIWPNVLTTVAELNPASIAKVVSSIGPSILFFLCMAGITLVMVKDKIKKEEGWIIGGSLVWYVLIMFFQKDISNVYLFLFMIALPTIIVVLMGLFEKTDLKIKHSILLLVFLTGTFLAATKGVRFVALFIPIASICIGISSGRIYTLASGWLTNALSINKILVRAVLVVIMLWVILPVPLSSGWNQTLHEIPSYNDAWDDTLTIINQSSEDAIITSWWDFGHWFVAGSERRVTFDGGSQGDRIHWVGRTLLTNSEKESLDILRMLNCGQNGARRQLEALYEDDYKAIKTLYKVIAEDREGGRKILEETGLKDENINSILEMTHCENLIDQYYIASEDMIGKSGVWGHFGVWDFDKAYLFNRIKSSTLNEGKEILMDEYNHSELAAKNLYYEIQQADGDQWISGWPSYGSSVSQCDTLNETKIACKTGLIYDIKNDEAFISTQEGLLHPKAFSYVLDGKFEYKEYEDGIDLGAVMFPNNGKLNSILTSPEQTASMFTRLYFFDGLGLEHFEQISHKVGIDGVDIYLYKVNWPEEE